MRELTIKIKFEEDCLGYNEDIPFSVECILNKYIKLDLEEDQIVKKGWTVEVTETVKCKYCAIISQGAAYMVCDENDNIITYTGSAYQLGEPDPLYEQLYPNAKQRVIETLKMKQRVTH